MSKRFFIGLATGLVALAPAPVDAYMSVFCGPGTIAGAVHMTGGGSPAWVAVKYGVHPVRIAQAGGGGLRVDTRRVLPRFPTSVDGLVLNVPECQVYLVHAGVVEKDYPVAVSTPDNPVPTGTTRVVSKQVNPTWFVPVSIQKEMAARGQKVKVKVAPGPGNPLGTRWIGFWNGSFGMHGTNVPTSIKRYASHGCVRFRAEDIKDLYERVWIGTPIRVVYQPVVVAVGQGSVWMSAYPDLYKKGFDYRGTLQALAAQAGVSGLIDWNKANYALARKDGILRDVGPGSGVTPIEYEAGTQRQPVYAEPVDPETGLTRDQGIDLPGTVYDENMQQNQDSDGAGWYQTP